MSLYRRVMLLRAVSSPSILGRPLCLLPSRHLAFSSAEEAAAERRRRKRRLRIEPPLHALRRDPSSPRPPRDPNAPRLPDSTSSLVGARLNLHNRVQSLIRSHDLDSASATARHAVFSSTRPTVFTCNAIIAGMYRAKRYDDAVALFRYFFDQCNLVPNVVSYNFLIVTYCESSRVDDALAVYRRILDSAPFSPSHVTYRHLTKGLVDAGRLPDSLSMLREMITRGHGADSLVFNNVIAGFLANEDLDKALELFDELRERCLVYDGTVVATFMDWYFQKGRTKEAMDAYQALLDKQFQMIPSTCNNLLEVLLRHGRTAEADRLFDGMLLRHSPPTFHAISTDTYNIMVNECFRKGDFDGAVGVFHRSGVKPLVMDVGCFNNIIGKLLENGCLEPALNLFNEMSGKSVNPDAETFGFFVQFYFKEGQVEDALRWFDDMVKQEGENAPKVRINSYNMVYDGLVKAGQINVAMEIFKKMWEKGLKPDSKTYEILITASCNECLLDQVQILVEEMVRIRVDHSPELRDLVSKVFIEEGRGEEEVEKMFTAPLPVAPPPPRFALPRSPQAYNQNPNFGTYNHSYNAGNQFPPFEGRQPPHVTASSQSLQAPSPQPPYNASYQFSPSAGTQPPYNVGNQSSQHPGPQPSYNASYQFSPSAGTQTPYNVGNQFLQAEGHQPPYNASYPSSQSAGTRPPYNVSNQFTQAAGPQPPYSASYQFSQSAGTQPPNIGSQFSQAADNQPSYNAGGSFLYAAGPQAPQVSGLQSVNSAGSSPFPGPQGNRSFSMPPPKNIAGSKDLHFTTSYEQSCATIANSQHFTDPNFSSTGSQTTNPLPPSSFHSSSQFLGSNYRVTHVDSPPPYTGVTKKVQETLQQKSNSPSFTSSAQPPDFFSSEGSRSLPYQSPKIENPQVPVNSESQTLGTSESEVPFSASWAQSGGNHQVTHFSAQSGMASVSVAPTSDFPSRYSDSPSMREINPEIGNAAVSKGLRNVSQQDSEYDYKQVTEIAGSL